MKKKEWKRVVREMELNNNAMAADIGQHKRDIASVWAIVGDEPGDSQDGMRWLPRVVQARMDELKRSQRHCDSYKTTAARAVEVIRALRAEANAMRPRAPQDGFIGPLCMHCGGKHLGIDCEARPDTGLPIRPGDVWRHPAFDDCVAVRDDLELGWQMLAGSGNVPIHMRDGTDWTFVRRGK